MNIYERSKTNGFYFQCSCVNCGGVDQWEELMKGHTKANQREVVKIALQAGVIEEWWAREELKKPYFNPYVHYKTKTHLIYVHSGIEHFIKVND